MTSLRLVIWSATSALAGFLFGFDTVVISGAEQTIQTLVAPERGRARHRDGGGALRHGGRVGDRRLAGRQVRPPPDTALDRDPVLRVRGVVADWRRTSIRSSSRGSSAGSASAISTVVAPLYIAEIAPPSSVDASPACSSSTSSSASSSPSSPTPGSPASARTRGAGCSASRRFPSLLYTAHLLHHPGEPAVADWQEAGPGRGPARSSA